MNQLGEKLETMLEHIDDIEAIINSLLVSSRCKPKNSKESLEFIKNLEGISKTGKECFTNAEKALRKCLDEIDQNTLHISMEFTQKFQTLFKQFHTSPKLSSSPYPPGCGTIPIPLNMLKPFDFVCVRMEDESLSSAINYSYILMMIYSINSDTKNCMVFDPENPRDHFEVSPEDYVPLSSSLPEVPDPKFELAKDSHVLSLWTSGNGSWTTEFYHAQVITPPSEKKPKKHMYSLQFFDEEDTQPYIPDVPAQFVISFPRKWR